MKVLVCIPRLLQGGMEVQTLSLVQALVAGGHEVVTFCCFEHTGSVKDEYMRAGARVVLMSPEGGSPTKGLSLVRNLFVGLREVIRGWHPDVAHVQYTASGAIPVVLLRLLGIKKVVATAHTSADILPSTGGVGFVVRRLLTAFTCMTRRAECSFFGSSSLYSPDTPLSRHGNHFTIYNSLPPYIEVTRSKRQFFWPPMVGVVSRLEEVKGMDLVVLSLIHNPAAMERLSQAAVQRAEEFTPACQAPLIRCLYDAIEKL